MAEGKLVGRAGDVEVVIIPPTDIGLRQDSDLVVVNVLNAAHLAVLLDEAIELAKGSGVKLDKGLA